MSNNITAKTLMKALSAALTTPTKKNQVISILEAFSSKVGNHHVSNDKDLEYYLKRAIGDESALGLLNLLDAPPEYGTALVELIEDSEGKRVVEEIQFRYSPIFQGFKGDIDELTNSDIESVVPLRGQEIKFEITLLTRAGQTFSYNSKLTDITYFVAHLLRHVQFSLDKVEILDSSLKERILKAINESSEISNSIKDKLTQNPTEL